MDKWFLRICALLSGLGGLAGVLYWLGVNPKDLRISPTMPHVAWLIVGLLLFATSIGSSAYSIYRDRRDSSRLILERDSARAETDKWKSESQRLTTEHREILNKIRAGWEQRTAELVKDLTQKSNTIGDALAAEVKQLKADLAAERAAFQQMVVQKDLERDKERAERQRLESEVAKGGAWGASAPTPAQQAAPSFPSLSALHNQTPSVTFDAHDWFRRAYYSPVTAEAENNIRIAAHSSSPTNHEAFYARFIGAGLVAYAHDLSWAYIYRSQFLLLQELNRLAAPVALSQAKSFYDAAVPVCPKVYPAYTFEQWLAWLKRELLIVVYPSNMVEITHKGKDLIKYLAHWGRSSNEKTC